MILNAQALLGAAGSMGEAPAGPSNQIYWAPSILDVGSAPSDLVFSIPWQSGLTVSVESLSWAPMPGGASVGDTVLQLSSNDTKLRVLSIQSISGVDTSSLYDVEVYVSFALLGSLIGNGGPAVRINGVYDSEAGYIQRLRRSENNESLTVVRNNSVTDKLTLAKTVDYSKKRARIRAQSGVIGIKSWDYNESEPATFREYTDTSPLAAGSIGFGKFGGVSSFPHVWVFDIGVGLNGESAPTGPL